MDEVARAILFDVICYNCQELIAYSNSKDPRLLFICKSCMDAAGNTKLKESFRSAKTL